MGMLRVEMYDDEIIEMVKLLPKSARTELVEKVTRNYLKGMSAHEWSAYVRECKGQKKENLSSASLAAKKKDRSKTKDKKDGNVAGKETPAENNIEQQDSAPAIEVQAAIVEDQKKIGRRFFPEERVGNFD